MRRLRAKTFLASAAVALLAFAVPASASAVEWQKNGEPLQENEAIQLEGFLVRDFSDAYQSGSHMFGCSIDAEAEFQAVPEEGPSTQLYITKFEPDLKSCVGTGVMTNCELTEASSNTSWPGWPIEIGGEASEPTIVTGEGFGSLFEWHKFTGCTSHWIEPWAMPWVSPQLALQPDDSGEISSVHITGDLPETMWTSEDWHTLPQSPLSVTPAGVYGIG